jgi:hypothetical protein
MNITHYERLNYLYRALDIFNFPEQIALDKQLQSLRVIYEYRTLHRSSPSITEIHNRLQNLAIEIFNTPQRTHLLHELMDTALELGTTVPTVETYRNLIQEYNQPFYPVQDDVDTHKPKDIYALDAIVGDSQNVHHSSINEHMKTIIKQLVSDFPPQPMYWIQLKAELLKVNRGWICTNLETLKFIYENTCNFTIGITLRQIALSVYAFIMSHLSPETQDELFRRFNEELNDMRNKCSTGHMSRLINVIQGFSERYTLNINPEQEIKVFIYQYLTRCLQEAPESVQDGMVEQTQEFREYILKDKYREVFQQRFGTDHSEWIEQCMKDYISS